MRRFEDRDEATRTLIAPLNQAMAIATMAVTAFLPGSMALATQVTIDLENRYPNVGTIMVWRVDDAGNPVELRGFASGTLIRDRVLVTAGHFTAPAQALGTLPPSIRLYASFSGTRARDPETWIPVVQQVTHPSMPFCPPPPQCDPTDDILVAPLQPGIRRRTDIPRPGTDGHRTRAPRRSGHAREMGRSRNDHRWLWHDDAGQGA